MSGSGQRVETWIADRRSRFGMNRRGEPPGSSAAQVMLGPSRALVYTVGRETDPDDAI
jgi:hypothetical protein